MLCALLFLVTLCQFPKELMEKTLAPIIWWYILIEIYDLALPKKTSKRVFWLVIQQTGNIIAVISDFCRRKEYTITLIGSLFHWVCYCKLKGYAKVIHCFSKDCNAKLRVVAKHSTLLINSSYYSTIRVLSYGNYHVGLIMLKSCWL